MKKTKALRIFLNFRFNFIYICLYILTRCCSEAVPSINCPIMPNKKDVRYDLSPLNWTFQFMQDSKVDNEQRMYYLSLCQPLKTTNDIPEECANSVACSVSTKDKMTFGNFTDQGPDVQTANIQSSAIELGTLFIPGPKCSPDGILHRRVVLTLRCGAHLGSPEFFLQNGCDTHFQWLTSAYCKQPPTNKEVPCYLYDSLKRKIDLTPLIKTRDGYQVETDDSVDDMFINVCSDIVPDDKTKSCPVGSSSCLKKGQFLSVGNLASPLELSKGGEVKIVYKSDVTPDGCTAKPQTTVVFRCPPRGLSHPPKLVSVSNCHYEVLWETDYACPVDHIEGDMKQCSFSRPLEGISLNLSPLIKEKDAYVVQAKINKTDFEFYLNPCKTLTSSSVNCSGQGRSSAVCMKSKDEKPDQSVGSLKDASLRYVEGRLTLIYPGTSGCSNAVIEFVCDQNADNMGKGSPKFQSFSDCVYYFEWNTKYACTDKPEEKSCYIREGKMEIDVSVLKKNRESELWKAVSDHGNDQNRDFYINVCGSIPQPSKLGCGVDAAACMKDKTGKVVSLGKFKYPPTYVQQSRSVQLTYDDGSECGKDKKIKSVITMQCKPGDLTSSPVLLDVSDDGCEFTFDWQTAAACPQNTAHGTDCKVFDEELGLYFDLTALTSDKPYKVDAGGYEYYLSVCGALKGTACNQKDGDSAACQVKTQSGKSWNLGKKNSSLSYRDGTVWLKYGDGTPYNDQNKTARSTTIVFLCDPGIGKGHPEFADEVNREYVFNWYTSYVCPSAVANRSSVECYVKDPSTGEEYDLSRMANDNRDNWVVMGINASVKNKFYLNVCHSLKPSKFCDARAAACVTHLTDEGEKELIRDIGHPSSRIKIEAGFLTLRYTDGLPCISYGKNINYTTTIHFVCPLEKESSWNEEPTFLKLIGMCDYSFLWPTYAACPVKKIVSNQCTITDPETGYKYDLQSLNMNNSAYTVSVQGKTYQINICGPLNSGPCNNANSKKNIAACRSNDTSEHGGTVIGLLENSTLSFEDGYLMLTYTGEKSNESANLPRVKILFKCDRLVSKPTLQYVEKTDHGEYVFNMATPLACGPARNLCKFTDYEGNQYDLTPLARRNGSNWEVSDIRSDHSNVKYHINFCRPLNEDASYKCAGSNIGACQTTGTSDNLGFSLGAQKNAPVVNNDGSLSVSYVGGSPCHNERFERSTQITLICSSLESLIFVGETPECEYLFHFKTPAACPLQSNIGLNCVVKDPQYGHEFNLAPLSAKDSDYTVTGIEHSYLLNVCGPLKNPPEKCKGAAVCQTKDDDPNFAVNAGMPNGNLTFRNGLIQLVYDSGKSNCHRKYNRSTVITFVCDHFAADKIGQPRFLEEDDDCTYMFEWATPYACPPFAEQEDCTTQDDKGNTYDLGGLSLAADNHDITPHELPGKKFVLNVCRSVVHKTDARCPYLAASCLISLNTTTGENLSAQNLGKLDKKPYFENGVLKVRYTSGDACTVKGKEGRKIETVIKFHCDQRMLHSEPEFLEEEDCTYYFSWTTTYACPLIKENSSAVTEDCVAINPRTGYHIDLTPLKRSKPYVVRGEGNHEYLLSVCEELTGSPCDKGVGSCQYEKGVKNGKSWNGGVANSQLHYRDGVYMLNYTDGDYCHQNQFRRNTIINFVCGSEDTGIGFPVFIRELENCTYVFEWHTTLACEETVHCSVTLNDHVVDLSRLTLLEGHYTTVSTTNVTAKYYMNVCRPLNPVVQEHCPSGAGVCMMLPNSTTGVSLGHNEHRPFPDFEGHLTLIYSRGSPCKNSPHLNYTSRIIFLCDPTQPVGQPVLVKYLESYCNYVFEWKTSVVCPPPAPKLVSSSCLFNDPKSGISFNLSLLKKDSDSPYKIDVKGKDASFLLNICENSKECGPDATVCMKSGNKVEPFGLLNNSTLFYDGRQLKLKYYSNEDCPLSSIGRRSTEIIFICDREAGIGSPFLHDRSSCLAVFTWRTDLVCQVARKGCFIEDRNNVTYSLKQLSSITHAWNITDKEGNKYWLNVCGSVPRNVGCPGNAGACYQKKGSNQVLSLGSMDKQVLLIDGNGSLVLSYHQGSTLACQNSKSAQVIVTFKCGRRLGTLTLVSDPKGDSCVFRFFWETIAACPIKRDEVMPETNGILYDERMKSGLNLTALLTANFKVEEQSSSRNFVYAISLSGSKSSVENEACSKAAVCQMNPHQASYRDIGSLGTRKFILKGTELLISLTSHGRKCGKNEQRNVSSVIYLQCSSAAGLGKPTFLYESNDCDYIFTWDTDAVCPDKFVSMDAPNFEEHKARAADAPTSSSSMPLIIGLLSVIVIISFLVLILAKKERRHYIAFKSRQMCCHLRPLNFHYRKLADSAEEGEALLLSADGNTCALHNDDSDDDLLT